MFNRFRVWWKHNWFVVIGIGAAVIITLGGAVLDSVSRIKAEDAFDKCVNDKPPGQWVQVSKDKWKCYYRNKTNE